MKFSVYRSLSALLFCFCVLLAALVLGRAPALHAQGMDLRQAAGVPLPASDLPAGTVSVRVIRGSFANNLPGVEVTFTVDGTDSVATTDAGGRAQVSGLRQGARVRASALVDGERLQSQETTIAASGVRFMLLASENGAAGPSGAAAPAVRGGPGSVTLGPESRIVVDYADERLNVYYVIHILNAASSPVDLGGPLIFELPVEARGATLMEGSSPQATVSGAHVTALSPFAPGRTDISIAYQLPTSGGTARLEQAWPAGAAPFSIFALRTGEMDLVSPQITGKQQSVQQGQSIVLGLTPALAAGERLVVDITGLPHHPVWPRNVALGMAGAITALGLWAAFVQAPRRRRA